MYLRLLLHRSVVGAHDESAVLLADPAQVCHWLRHNNLWSELSPRPVEERVAHSLRPITAGRRPVVQLPQLSLRHGRWEKLEVITLIPWDTPRGMALSSA